MKVFKKHFFVILSIFLVISFFYKFFIFSINPIYRGDFIYRSDIWLKDYLYDSNYCTFRSKDKPKLFCKIINSTPHLWDGSELNGFSKIYGGRLTREPLYHILAILSNKFNIQFNITERIFWFLPLLIAGSIGTYLFLYKNTNDKTSSLYGAIFVITNNLIFIRISNGQINLLLPIFFIPTLCFLIDKFFKKPNFINANILIFILNFLLFFEIRMNLLTFLFIGSYSLLRFFTVQNLEKKKILIYTFWIAFISILLNFYWIFFLFYKTGEFYSPDISSSIFQHSDFLTSILFIRRKELFNGLWFSPYFLFIPIVLFIYYIVFIIKKQKKLTKKDIFFLIWFILLFYASLWTQDIFEQIANNLKQYNFINFLFLAFRNPLKLAYINVFPFIYISSKGLKNIKNKKIKISLILLLLLSNIQPLIYKKNIFLDSYGTTLEKPLDFNEFEQIKKYMLNNFDKFSKTIWIYDDPTVSLYSNKYPSFYINSYSSIANSYYIASYIRQNLFNFKQDDHLSGILDLFNFSHICLWPKDNYSWPSLDKYMDTKQEVLQLKHDSFSYYKNAILQKNFVQITTNPYIYKINKKNKYGLFYLATNKIQFIGGFNSLDFFSKQFETKAIYNKFNKNNKDYITIGFDKNDLELILQFSDILNLQKYDIAQNDFLKIYNKKETFDRLTKKKNYFASKTYNAFVNIQFPLNTKFLLFEAETQPDPFTEQTNEDINNKIIIYNDNNLVNPYIIEKSNYSIYLIPVLNTKQITIFSPDKLILSNITFLSSDFDTYYNKIFSNLDLLFIPIEKFIQNKEIYKNSIKYAKYIFIKNDNNIQEINKNVLNQIKNINNLTDENSYLIISFSDNFNDSSNIESSFYKNTNNESVNFEYINSSLYKIYINKQNVYLIFNQNFNKNFVLINENGEKIYPFMANTAVNAFYIKNKGKYLLLFEPDRYLTIFYKLRDLAFLLIVSSFIFSYLFKKNDNSNNRS